MYMCLRTYAASASGFDVFVYAAYLGNFTVFCQYVRTTPNLNSEGFNKIKMAFELIHA